MTLSRREFLTGVWQPAVLCLPKTPLKNSSPAHLSEEAQYWWARLASVYDGQEDAVLLLQIALEAFDRLRGAQA